MVWFQKVGRFTHFIIDFSLFFLGKPTIDHSTLLLNIPKRGNNNLVMLKIHYTLHFFRNELEIISYIILEFRVKGIKQF